MKHKTKILRLNGYTYIAILLLFFLSCVERPLDPDQLTRPLPTVVGTEITDYGAHTAAVRGNVQKEGTSNVSSRGFCWSESENPTVEDNKINAGSGTGEFTATIKGLKPGTRYYVRPYAANNNGTSYGPADSFTTLSIPTVMTADVTDITLNSAVSGGSISDDGEVEIIARGVCWSTTENPTVEDDTTRDGSGAGSFTSNITGLIPGNQYYVRAYATYADSTQYGEQIQFATTGFNLSGKVTKGGSGLAGVTITASGRHDQTVETDNNGGYSISGIPHGSNITITPSRTGYSFTPSNRTISAISSNQTNQNFTASTVTYTVSGTVSGAVQNNVTITISGDHSATTQTGSNGSYSISGIPHGSNITITPSRTGYSFTPSNRTISDISSNQTNQDFTASAITYTVSGTVSGAVQNNVTITVSNDHSASTQTSSNGSYSISGIPQGSNITITPSRTGYSFSPPNRTISNISSNYTNQNFSGDKDGDVLNPATGKTWMDRNLGAYRAANSSTDEQSYGHLYQWGRAADGHQVRTSGTTSTLSSSDTPGHGDFILAPNSPYDWRSPQNDNLWQGASGTNNPCPSGYRLPTEAEWEAERQSWISNNAAGAFASPLELPVAGGRTGYDGSLYGVGSLGYYWSSSVSGFYSRLLYFSSSTARMDSSSRASGTSVRCLKDSP